MHLEGLSMKKVRSNTYYKVIYKLFLPLFRIVAFFVYGVAAIPKKYKEPILVLANHTSDMDFLVVAAHISNHMYFVCDRHVVDKGLFGKLFNRWFNPIAVFKGSYKMAEVMEIIRRVRSGGSILLFPEGRLSHNGKTLNIDPATAKLAKALKCRVITFRSSGGYFKQPRWQEHMNTGWLFSSGIVNEYDKEYVANAPVEELLQHIREDLYVDAYAEQAKKQRRFWFKRGAEGITRCYDVCPKCHTVDTLYTYGRQIFCKCGYKMIFDAKGYLHGDPQIVSTTSEWEELQNEVYRRHFAAGVYFMEDKVMMLFEFKDKCEISLSNLASIGTLEGRADRIIIGDFQFLFEKIEKMELMFGGRWLVFGYEGRHFMISDNNACFNKYIALYLWATGQPM